MLGLGGGPLYVPPPQIASLPAPEKEQLDLPEGPRLWGLSAYKVGSGRLCRRLREGWREQCPHRAQRYGHAEGVGGPVSVQGMRGEAGHIRSQEAGPWGSCWTPGFGLCWGGLWALMCV